MDSRLSALTYRVGVSVFTLLLVIAACSTDGTRPINGVWLRWEPARSREAAKLIRLVPSKVPIGLVPLDRQVETLSFRRTFRGVVAKPDGSRLKSPLVVYVSKGAPSQTSGFPTETVEIGDGSGELRSTALGSSVRWQVGRNNAIVAADAGRDGVVVTTARGLVLPEDRSPEARAFRGVPRGFRVITARWTGPVKGKVATARYRSSGGPLLELSITAQRIEGFDPLLAAVPVHADAGAARRTRVRGADALYLTSSEPGFPRSAGPMMRGTLAWMEHPNLVVSMSARATSVELEVLRRIARSLERVQAERWNRMFPER